ncbi:MAG: hypothetical protein JNN15_20640 [Blastocatellia bacterium]|nr:hypothetical protein [Blastocatellia bacterium]
MVSTVVLSASIMTVGVKLILFLMLAISYLAISILLERRGVESKVWLTVEASGSITTAASVFLTLFLASYHSFGCLFASILGVGYFVAAHHFCRSPLSKTYPYAAIISLTASTMNLLSCYKITAWSEIAPIFTTLLIAYLLVAAYLKEGIYSRAFFAVAECLMPMVIIVTAISELDSPSTAFNRAFFFTAVGIFYMLSTNFYKKALTIYAALTAFAISLWNIAVLVDIDKNFFATLYAFAAIGLLMLSKRVLENRYSWAASSLLNAANTLLVTSIAGAILQSTASLLSIKGSAKLQVINMLMVTAVTGLFSIVLEQLELKKLCRWAAYGLACYTHFVFGLYLGYDIFRQAEFYGLPIGFSLIMIGYLQSQKEHRVLMGWFWLGSLMIASPLMLHSLQYRFIDAQPSSQHDLFTIIVSLVLIFVGIAKQFKAPTIVGSSCFLIEIASIIFSFVEWEQKWLSISMITIAVVIFSSSWAIYFFHKKNRLAEELKRQSRNVIEEFGKWR